MMRQPAAIGFLIYLAMASTAWAATIQVPAEQPTIQAGLDAALGGDTVLVASGVYSGPGNWDLDFRGQPLVLRSATGNPADCIIDCADAKPHIGVYFHSGEDSSTVLDGFTIQHGMATHEVDFPPSPAGGGIFCSLSRPLLKNLILRLNSAPSHGMGAGFASDGYVFSAGPILRDCVIEKNSPGGVFVYGTARFERCRIQWDIGGGIHLFWGKADFIDCIIAGDAVYPVGGGEGIAFRNCAIAAPFDSHHGATVSFFDCTLTGHRLHFSENSLAFYRCTISDCPDGAVDTYYGFSLTAEDCLFVNNQTSTTGGAIRLGPWDLATIRRTRFVNNSAAGRGGAVDIGGADSAQFIDCEFLGNTAGGGEGGGAIASRSDSGPQLTGCTLVGNSALGGAPGGAISFINWETAPRLSDCLIAGNTSEGAGGALYLAGDANGAPALRIQGSTLAANRAGTVGGAIATDPALSLATLQCDSTLIWQNCAGTAGDQLFLGSTGVAAGFACSVVDSSGVSGGTVSYGPGTGFADPRFCLAPDCEEAPFTETEGFALEAGSYCLPAHNPCGVQIGALGQGCTLTALPGDAAPGPARLAQNYPNPFNASTRLDFTLAAPGPVTLSIFDAAGRERAVLLAGASLGAGPHRLDWDGRDREGRSLPSGVYLCRLCTADGTLSRKLVLVE